METGKMGRKRSEWKRNETKDLFVPFVKDTKEFFSTGKQPDSCARDMQYSLIKKQGNKVAKVVL